ncbi:hypothetical protein [Vineibacter terrae]|uniref:Uncharacterized protein n=1 Tax=Vineibacter terrae TaxID=2586908 RepID=A0A5C8PRA7_9HYPH|nr:hypothetical protein [Vineibacter terrae]TXL78100.1 hypothetical protein FHP25_07805 [Vineibacter terrae]HEX2889508.1 hypothetical protein [Vineibacter terrae]
MAMTSPSTERPTTVRLHPWIFRGVVALAAWALLAAWGFAATWSPDVSESYTDLALVFVSYLCIVTIGLVFALGSFARHSPDPARDDDKASRGSFHDWRSREIEVGSGHQRGSHVAVDILLAPAAIAIGMTALVIVWHLAPAAG